MEMQLKHTSHLQCAGCQRNLPLHSCWRPNSCGSARRLACQAGNPKNLTVRLFEVWQGQCLHYMLPSQLTRIIFSKIPKSHFFEISLHCDARLINQCVDVPAFFQREPDQVRVIIEDATLLRDGMALLPFFWHTTFDVSRHPAFFAARSFQPHTIGFLRPL